MRSDDRYRMIGVLALTLSMTGWGVSFAMNRWMLEGTPLAGEPWKALSLASFRFLLAGPVLVVWAALILRRRGRVSLRDWGQLSLLGLLGVVGYHLLAGSGQSYASSSLNAVLHQMTPVVAFVGGLVFLRERLSALKLLGLAVASAGALWYSLLESEGALAGDNIPLAALMVSLVAVDWTLYLVLAKRALRRWSAVELTVLSNAVGAVMLLAVAEALRPAGLGVTWPLAASFDPAAWLALAYLGLVAGVVCYLLWIAGLKRLEGSRVAVFGYLLVPVAMVTASFLPGKLHESLSPSKVAAAALIIAGVWLVTWRRKKDAKADEEEGAA